jgi:hypothetical protein
MVEGLRDKGRLHERNGRDGHNFILPSWASRLLFGRLDRMRYAGPAIARHPDPLTIYAAVQLSAVLVLAHKSHQGGEAFQHGAGRLPQALTPRPMTALTAFERQT